MRALPRLLLAPVMFLSFAPGPAAAADAPRRPPNIVYILADDLGYNDVGCYGQQKIRTPNIDRLAKEGMRFTQHYSGSPVCAPSRCCLMTGYHTGHAYIRTNRGGFEKEGQEPIPPDTRTLARLLKRQGYATIGVGKWGLGGPDSTGLPTEQGFDSWFGYLCQAHAHNHYPSYLRRGAERVELKNPEFAAHQRLKEAPQGPRGYDRFKGTQYAPDLMAEEALRQVRAHKDRPFFLYYATTVPHVAIQVPDDSLEEYLGKFPETPYIGEKGYLPHPAPRAGYAAMITRMDRDVGRILDLIKELGLEDDTLVFFSSDNGPTYNGGTDSEFFDSNGPLRGLKGSVYEGGIRVPMIARWPGKIAAGSTTDHPSAFWDLMPTVLEAVGAEPPGDIDGISFLPTLLGKGGQKQHEYLYWELGNQQAVRAGDWKLVRVWNRKTKQPAEELFNLKEDLAESKDLAGERPAELARMRRLMEQARTPSEVFPSPFYDQPRKGARKP
ncbi:MAG TPA: arylsulfatase [Gemmataceae bacterium]